MATRNKIGQSGGRSKKWLFNTLYALVVLALLGFGVYYFLQYRELRDNPVYPEEAAQAQVSHYIEEVGQLYDLPDDETPSVATVKDREQLQEQEFFAQAENGDITLIYQNARLAILYRPSTQKLINVSTVTIDEAPTVTVIGPGGGRGTVVADLANEQIQATEGGASEVVVDETIVVDVSEQNQEAAERVAEVLEVEVSDLPEGQEVPEGADILVIVGS